MDINLTIKTDRGDIQIEMFPNEAPLTVSSFVNLAQRGYYDGLTFHRVISEFMIQGGDPSASGSGGPGYQFKDECCDTRKHEGPGVLSMANAGPGTNGSQFFITHGATPHLDGKHTVFGKVTTGQDVVNAIQQGDKMNQVTAAGDTAALLEANSKQIEEWNNILEKKYPASS